MPERSSFRFSRKIQPVEVKVEEAEQTETIAPVHEPLPFISHLSTNSLYNLFQDQAGFRDVDTSTIGEAITSPLDVKIICPVSSGLQESNHIPTSEVLSSHHDPTAQTVMPTPPLKLTTEIEQLHTATSSPSSGFRETNDSSCCSRKSSTSSVGSLLATHKSYIENMEAVRGVDALAEIPQNSPDWPLITHIQDNGRSESRMILDKPLPLPPAPEEPFSISSAVSLMRADSISTSLRMQHVEPGLGSPVSFRQKPTSEHKRYFLHKKSASMALPIKQTPSPRRPSTAGASPKSRRGQRLGKAMYSKSKSLDAVGKELFQPPIRGELHRIEHIYTTGPDNRNVQAPQEVDVDVEQEFPAPVSASAAEKIVFKIMLNLDNPIDLLATARLSRGFYDTFRRREPQLVDAMLFRISPPAWEFQKNSAEASMEPLSLRSYTRDNAALGFIKSSLLSSCDSNIRPETLAGIVGADAERKSRVDDALWRIWTFCKGFGYRSLEDVDLPLQVDWLNGGRIARQRFKGTSVGAGNGTGISKDGLEDLLELWECFDILLASFRGRCAEAREVGIFKNCSFDETHTEGWYLDEWTFYIRSLGLPAVLSLSSSLSFEKAQESGFTEWTPPAHGHSREEFFRSAVMSAYQERVLAEAAANATQVTLPPRSIHRPGDSVSSLEMLERAHSQHIIPLQSRPSQMKRKPLPPIVATFDHEKSVWQPETPDTPLPKHLIEAQQSTDLRQPEFTFPARESNRESVYSPIRNSTVIHSLGMTATASTRLGATLFPMEYPPTSPTSATIPTATIFPRPKSQAPVRRALSPPSSEPAVVDPSDKAMALLTKEMGFPAADASRALAKCDTGFGIDVQRAIEMLTNEKRHVAKVAVIPPAAPAAVTIAAAALSPTTPTTATPTSPRKAKLPREYCTGHPPGHFYSSSTDSAVSLGDTWPVRNSSLAIDVGVSVTGLGARLSRMTSKAKAYKVLGIEKKDISHRTGCLVPSTADADVDVDGLDLNPQGLARMRSVKMPKTVKVRPVAEEGEGSAAAEQPQSAVVEQQLVRASRLPVRTRSTGKKSAKLLRLGGIEEEPRRGKALRVLGLDEEEMREASPTPTPSLTTMMEADADGKGNLKGMGKGKVIGNSFRGKRMRWNLGRDNSVQRSVGLGVWVDGK